MPGDDKLGAIFMSTQPKLDESLQRSAASPDDVPAFSEPALSTETVLRPRKGWQPIDLEELWRSRELFGFLVWRDISIRYKQTFLGGLWAILQPLLAMLIFTVFFNRLAGIQGDGVPYP